MYKCREIARAYKYELIARSFRSGSCARRFENISRGKESCECRERTANFYADSHFRKCNLKGERAEPEWEIVFCFRVFLRYDILCDSLFLNFTI